MPVIVIEVVMIFGGALCFGWWQLRSIKRDQAEAAAREAAAKALTSPPVRPHAES